MRVPIGDDAAPFVTMPFTRTVLIVARTVTTTHWVLDFVSELLDDTRIQVLFTVEDDKPSVYHEGAYRLLDEIGAVVVPWSQAVAGEFDLVISPTYGGSLHDLQSRLMILLHGPGFGKPGTLRADGAIPMPRDPHGKLESSGLPLTTLVLSHPDQHGVLPELPDGVEVVMCGDPCIDRMTVSDLTRFRYRSALGLAPGQRLVVTTSTWGPGAQIAAFPDLAVRLARELPVDSYRVAMVVHPNVWYGHSRWQLQTWLRRGRELGVLAAEPENDSWRSLIVAADVVICDHGSVGFYAAALGRPMLTCSFHPDLLMSSSPLHLIYDRSSRLDVLAPLRDQIDDAVAAHTPDHYGELTEQISGGPGISLRLFRSSIYRLLSLDEPADPPVTHAVSVPAQPLPPITAHLVDVTVGDSCIVIERHPAARTHPPPPPPPPANLTGRNEEHIWWSPMSSPTSDCCTRPQLSFAPSNRTVRCRRFTCGRTKCSTHFQHVARSARSNRLAAALSPSFDDSTPRPCTRSASPQTRHLLRQSPTCCRCTGPEPSPTRP